MYLQNIQCLYTGFRAHQEIISSLKRTVDDTIVKVKSLFSFLQKLSVDSPKLPSIWRVLQEPHGIPAAKTVKSVVEMLLQLLIKVWNLLEEKISNLLAEMGTKSLSTLVNEHLHGVLRMHPHTHCWTVQWITPMQQLKWSRSKVIVGSTISLRTLDTCFMMSLGFYCHCNSYHKA